jgi:hypothetical protein
VYNIETTPTAPRAPAVSINADTLLDDRYEGIVLDQGWASMTGDSINGGNVGIQVVQYSGQTYGANGNATLDTIRNESVAAVQVDSDQASADLHGVLTIAFSDLRGNAARVLDNSSNYTVLQLRNQ